MLLDHVPAGGRALSMHCAEQAAIAQPAMGLWQQQSMRSGEGKVCSREAEQMQSGAQRSWMLLLHHPGSAAPGRDSITMNTGQEPVPQEKCNHPPLITPSSSGFGSASGGTSGVHQSRTVDAGLCPQQREGSASSGGPTASEAKYLFMRSL